MVASTSFATRRLRLSQAKKRLSNLIGILTHTDRTRSDAQDPTNTPVAHARSGPPQRSAATRAARGDHGVDHAGGAGRRHLMDDGLLAAEHPMIGGCALDA